MSSMSSVAGLSKYIRTLPSAKMTALIIVLLSFVFGSIIFLITPVIIGSTLENIFYGGAFGFAVFGIPTIISGSTDQFWVNSMKGINLKMRHSLFLSLISMTIASLVRSSFGICIQYSGFVDYNSHTIFQSDFNCHCPTSAYYWDVNHFKLFSQYRKSLRARIDWNHIKGCNCKHYLPACHLFIHDYYRISYEKKSWIWRD